MRKRLNSGFGSLTVNPSPRPRAPRQRLENDDPIREAGKDVARAMTGPIRSLSNLVKSRSTP
ncbi:MAG TPA: hypothetical protein VH089_11675 [Streptosporangiaceae bacterium]|nr:hypothetical protein [Streptosporangiaceae bacterium]